MLPRRTITSDWSWYIVSVIKKERECSGYSNVVSGTGDIVKRIIRGELQGNFRTRCFSDGERGPYNPVGRNKLPKKSKREQKNTRATYYYQSDSIKKENYLFEKETATSSVTKASAKRTAH